MLKKIRYILLTMLIAFVFLNNVYADASFDAAGNIASGASGGSIKGTSSGFSLLLSPMLKFTLVDISDSNKLVVKSTNYMINTTGTYDDYLKNSNLEGSMNVRGYIDSNGNYSTEVLNVADKFFPDGVHFELSIMQKIIPNKRGAFLNFSVENLKNTICNFDSNGKCNVTSAYENVVLYMLSEAGISLSSLSSMDNDTKSKIVNYRIIIEPIYAFKYGSKYRFSTIKAMGSIGAGVNTSGTNPYFGVYVKQLYYNTYASQRHGSINSTGFKFCEETSASAVVNCYKNLADTNNGAGYAIFQLSYDIPNTCKIEKSEIGDFLFYNKEGAVFNNNLDNSNGGTPGSNFEYFISDGQCRCDAVNNSSYKDELLDIPIIKSIYDANCTTPKLCDYEKIGSDYKFYDNSGNLLSGYEAFADKCGCNSAKVLELKNIFTSIYNDTTVCGSEDISTPNGSFGYCTVNNTVSLTREKTVNQYCKRTCIEKIEFNNVPDTRNDIYESGKYFNLSNYPSLISTKECTLDFDYNKWVGSVGGATGYKYYLSKSVESYNDWQKYSNVSSSKGSCCDLNPYGGCYEYYYTYTSSYSGFVVSADGLNLSSQSYTANLGTYCGTKSFSVEANNASANYLSYSTTISSLKDSLNACDSAINFDVSNFYSPVNSLKFRYQQDILEINTITSMWNDANNGKKRDDSQLNEVNKTVTRYCNGVLLSASQNCEYPTENLFDNISGSSIEENTTRIKSSNLSRKEIISNTYEASVDKYIEPLTGNIVTSGTHLGKYFDIDVKAIEKNDNKNEFTFTSIGENPNSNTSLYKLTTQDNLTRACTYKTINKIIECPTGNCSDGTSSSLKILYRVVDPNNVDPNNRLGTDAGFKNWNNKKGQTVLSAIESSDTYNPENLEYSFTLDSASIKKIREYNSSCDATGNCNPIKYSDTVSSYSVLSCNNDGNECTSKFIDELAKSNGEFGKNIATNIDGRDKWKYLIYNTYTNNWSIEVKSAGDMESDTFNSLITQYKGLGVDVTP